MGLGDRFSEWIEERRTAWGDVLGTWLMDRLAAGMTKSLEDMEPGLKDMAQAAVDRLQAEPAVPQEIKDQLSHAMEAGNWLETVYIELTILFTAIGTLLGGSIPLSNELRYAQDYLKRSARLDPISVMTAWRRDPEKYEKFFDDLREQGWSEDRIEALKFFTEVLPSPQEAISLMAHEAFEEGMVAKYGLDDEFENLDFAFLEKIGITRDIARLHWRGHWEHASFIQVVEMYRRKLMTEDDFREWFRVVEIPPFWRDKLIKISAAWPTRVDVRRWWDMRVIDETELRRLYAGMGYEGENLDNYVIWTKVYTEFPSLLARWSKGWITLDELRAETIALGMPAERVETFIQEKIKKNVPEPIDEAKKVSQTAIIKWVKGDTEARWEQGIDLLMDLGYDNAGARFVLDAYIADMGSPETFEEWKRLTSEYRRAAGMTTQAEEDKLREARDDLVRISEEVKSLEEAVKAEELKLADQDVIPDETKQSLTDAQVALNRALAEKARIQAEFDTEVAKFKQTSQ